jgi:hypothetical protein
MIIKTTGSSAMFFVKNKKKISCLVMFVALVVSGCGADSGPTYVGDSSVSLVERHGALLCDDGCFLYGVRLQRGYTEVIYNVERADRESGDRVHLADGDPWDIRNVDLMGVLWLISPDAKGVWCSTHSRVQVESHEAWNLYGSDFPEVVCPRRPGTQ